MERWEPITREICREALDRIGDATEVDAATAYAQHIPVLVIARMLGLPEEDGDQFRLWLHELLEIGPGDPEVGRRAFFEIYAYLGGHIERRRADPADDLLGFLLGLELDGEPLPTEHIIGTATLLLLAGIDTTWSSIGSALWHLARTPGDRRRMIDEPELAAGRDRGVAPRVRAGDHGPLRRRGHGALRRQGLRGTADAPPLPCSQPRPEPVPGRRPGHHRPCREPPRHVRPRHPPLSRARTSRGWSCASPSRSGSPAFRSSSSPTPARSRGRSVRSADPDGFRCGSSPRPDSAPQQLAHLGGSVDRRRVRSDREQVERSASRVDVGREELGDVGG